MRMFIYQIFIYPQNLFRQNKSRRIWTYSPIFTVFYIKKNQKLTFNVIYKYKNIVIFFVSFFF